jgi:hypothetical protein
MESLTEMQKTADSIVGSFDTRIAALGNLKRDMHETLNDFASNRKKSSKEQGATLASFAKCAARANAEMCERLAKASSLRHKASSLRHKDVDRMLREFQDNHRAMALELTTSLREFDGNRVAEATEQTANRKQFLAGIEKEVSGLLKGFTKDHDRMSRKLHSDLSDWVLANAKETQDLLSGFQKDITAAHSAWVDLTRTMAARRNGEQTAPKAPRRSHPRHKAAKK